MRVPVPIPPYLQLLDEFFDWCDRIYNFLYTRVSSCLSYLHALQRCNDVKVNCVIRISNAISVDIYEAAVWLSSYMARAWNTNADLNSRASRTTATVLPASYSSGGFTPEIVATEYTRLTKLYPGMYVIYFIQYR